MHPSCSAFTCGRAILYTWWWIGRSCIFFFSSRRRHTRSYGEWSSDVCSSDLTGVEAPSSAIAQLGQLDQRGRKLFGQVTLWLTLLIVGGLTLGLTALAVHLGTGIPPRNSTQIAELARAAGSPLLFALF